MARQTTLVMFVYGTQEMDIADLYGRDILFYLGRGVHMIRLALMGICTVALSLSAATPKSTDFRVIIKGKYYED